jgi:hypothetical protein
MEFRWRWTGDLLAVLDLADVAELPRKLLSQGRGEANILKGFPSLNYLNYRRREPFLQMPTVRIRPLEKPQSPVLDKRIGQEFEAIGSSDHIAAGHEAAAKFHVGRDTSSRVHSASRCGGSS